MNEENEFRKKFKINTEDYEDYEGNLLFEEDFLENFDDDENIKNILKNSGNSDEIMEIRRQEKIMRNIYQELKEKNNPIIHNFVCYKNLKNHNIKLGIIFHSSKKTSLRTTAELISNLVLNNIEFENLIVLRKKLLILPTIDSIKDFDKYNMDLITFAYCNKKLFNYRNMENLVIVQTFSINENCININIL